MDGPIDIIQINTAVGSHTYMVAETESVCLELFTMPPSVLQTRRKAYLNQDVGQAI